MLETADGPVSQLAVYVGEASGSVLAVAGGEWKQQSGCVLPTNAYAI